MGAAGSSKQRGALRLQVSRWRASLARRKPNAPVNASVKFTESLVRLGINYKFPPP
jgi:hypothetical protein